MTVTIKDVAREARVSVASVSRALNGAGAAPLTRGDFNALSARFPD